MAIGKAKQFRNMEVLMKKATVDGQPLYDPTYGKTWYVDAKNGSDSNGGTSWDGPFLTMGAAFAVLGSGDTIRFVGKVKEQLESPVGVFDVTIIGVAPAPRHADDHSESGSIIGGTRGSSAATWTAPASGSTASALLRVQQQGWKIVNVVFQISGSATICLEQYKTDDSGDDERDGGHLNAINCRFVGSGPGGIGVQRSGGNGYSRYIGCGFQGLDTAMKTGSGGGGQDGFQLIEDCWFEANTTGIDCGLYRSRLIRNYFLPGHTLEFDLTGGAGNIWEENIFHGNSAFETNIAGTGDFIIGRNWAGDTGSGDVDDTTGYVSAAPNGS